MGIWAHPLWSSKSTIERGSPKRRRARSLIPRPCKGAPSTEMSTSPSCSFVPSIPPDTCQRPLNNSVSSGCWSCTHKPRTIVSEHACAHNSNAHLKDAIARERKFDPHTGAIRLRGIYYVRAEIADNRRGNAFAVGHGFVKRFLCAKMAR